MKSLLSPSQRATGNAHGGGVNSSVAYIPRASRAARTRSGRRTHCNKFQARVAPARNPVFESRGDMMAFAIRSAMIAVMHYDDVAMRSVHARNARERCDQSLRRL